MISKGFLLLDFEFVLHEVIRLLCYWVVVVFKSQMRPSMPFKLAFKAEFYPSICSMLLEPDFACNDGFGLLSICITY